MKRILGLSILVVLVIPLVQDCSKKISESVYNTPTQVFSTPMPSPQQITAVPTSSLLVKIDIPGKILFESIQAEGWISNIFVVNADGTNKIQLTNSGKDSSPSWSPEGKKILFLSQRDDNPGIYVMNSDGSDQTNLTNSRYLDSQPKWSPDGTEIAFLSDRDIAVYPPGSDYTDFCDLYIMNSDGTNLKRLTFLEGYIMDYSWSPDGKLIAFDSSQTNGINDIYVIDTDGGSPINLTNNNDVELDPSWSPDGKKILFSRFVEINNHHRIHLFTMDTTGANQHVLISTPSSKFQAGASWSPDGKKILYLCDNDICVVNADGTEQVKIVLSIWVHVDQINSLKWSSNGDWIAFRAIQNSDFLDQTIRSPFGSLPDLFICSEKGENLVNLTKTIMLEFIGDWLP